MKRIKSRRQLAAGVIALVLALLCFVVMGLRGFQPRYLAAGLLALVWSSVSLSPQLDDVACFFHMYVPLIGSPGDSPG